MAYRQRFVVVDPLWSVLTWPLDGSVFIYHQQFDSSIPSQEEVNMYH